MTPCRITTAATTPAKDEYAPWLAELRARLPAGGSVLDLGCGNGVPVARSLAAAGYQVTGVDISDVQVERARRLVPAGTFIRADATVIEFPPRSFDAIVCLYSLIHMPLAAQPGLLRRTAGWLRPTGWLLAVTGHSCVDRHRRQLAWRAGLDVVEPGRRGHLPLLA